MREQHSSVDGVPGVALDEKSQGVNEPVPFRATLPDPHGPFPRVPKRCLGGLSHSWPVVSESGPSTAEQSVEPPHQPQGSKLPDRL